MTLPSVHLTESATVPAATPLSLVGLGNPRGHQLLLQRIVSRVRGQPLGYENLDRLATLIRRIRRRPPNVVLAALDQERDLNSVQEILDAAPEIPLVVLVRKAQEALAVEAVRLGAQDYLLIEKLTPDLLGRTLRLACERHRHLVALRDLSLTDPLTGLYNRRGFYALAEAQRRMAKRLRCHCVLLCADLDNLKSINDELGHLEGDRAILRASQVLRSSLRDSDLLARFGGDEFVALAYDAGDDTIRVLSRRIMRSFQRANAEDTRYPLSVSLGAVVFSGEEQTDLARLMDRADQSLYRHKRSRRGSGEVPALSVQAIEG